MLTKLFNRLQGQVEFWVECPFPERVLNLCSQRGLSFWQVAWRSPTSFSCTMGRQDYARLRHYAKQLECTLHPVRRQGLPFFLGRMRHRHVLFYGGICVTMALVLSTFFIWDFDVYGNKTVSETAILRALQRNGIQIGTFGMNVDSQDLRNHVLLELPELVWLSINVSGCRAFVQVQERVVPPALEPRTTPSNVVATQDGLVLWVNALDGQAMVLPHTTVVKDQLLIAGISDVAPYGAQLRTGLGTVTARTWRKFSTMLPAIVEKKVYTGETRTRWSLIFGTREINFFQDSSIWGANCDKLRETSQWALLGLPLPLTTVKETLRPYYLEEVGLTAQTAQTLSEEILSPYLRSQLGGEGTVSSALVEVTQTDAGWQGTLHAECEEQIGKLVPIYTDENPPP